MAKYKIYKFAGEWHLYDNITPDWRVLLFSSKVLPTVVRYMDADASGDYRTCYHLKMASAMLCRGFGP
jgi:hypothetical protein